MKRFALAAVLAALVGSQADAQYYYSYPSYTYPGSVVVAGSSYYPGTSYYSPYTTGGIVNSGYYTQPYSTGYYSSGYYSPSYYSGYYNTGTYISPRYGSIGGRRLWRW
jgi:hypothetical protein